MALKLYNDTDVAAIADAIRSKNGSADKYTVSQMAGAITALQAQESMPPMELPDYVRQEAARVAAEARKYITNDSIVVLSLSDTHFFASQTPGSAYANTDTGDTHAMMAIKALSYLLPVDFVAHLGDFSAGNASTTLAVRKEQMEKCENLALEAAGDLPVFFAIGNHDTGTYHSSDMTPGDYLYQHFTAHSASDNTVISGQEYGGYCYRDFPDKKLRVFLLNTSEKLVISNSDSGASVTQQKWVANALLNLAAKSDAAQWGFIVLSHYALDYGDARDISNVFGAYVNGDSLTVDGTTFNFSGKNAAKFLCQIHGHFHCFSTARLHSHYNYTAYSDPMKEYDAWRICTPNASYGMENSYTSAYYGITFGEATSYPKTVNSAKDTSFVINVINPSEQVVHSVCYGAGYDRTVGIAAIAYYTISSTLSNCTIDNSTTSVQEGEAYSATITPNDKYTLSTVTVTMGGTDITSAAYSGGKVSIAKVTGNVVIKATATKVVTYTNLVPTSIDTTGAIYNGVGYKNGYCLSGSGAESSGMGTFTITGYMPYSASKNKALRVGGSALVSQYENYGWRCSAYDASFNHLMTIALSKFTGHVSVADDVLLIDDLTQFNGFKSTDAAYIRISCATGNSSAEVNGAGLIVTLDQVID